MIKRLEKKVRLSTGPTCQLLAGHRGSGKSTELRMLEEALGRGDPRYFVVYIEGRQALDLNDVDFPEILIAVIRHTAEELKARMGISLKPGYFKDRLGRLKKLLGSDVDFEKLELGAGLLKVSGAIKNSPDARDEVRKVLEPDTGNLLYAANDVIGEAKTQLKRQGCHDLVVVMDDLDHMVCVRTAKWDVRQPSISSSIVTPSFPRFGAIQCTLCLWPWPTLPKRPRSLIYMGLVRRLSP